MNPVTRNKTKIIHKETSKIHINFLDSLVSDTFSGRLYAPILVWPRRYIRVTGVHDSLLASTYFHRSILTSYNNFQSYAVII